MDITFRDIKVILYYEECFLRQKLARSSLPLHDDFIDIVIFTNRRCESSSRAVATDNRFFSANASASSQCFYIDRKQLKSSSSRSVLHIHRSEIKLCSVICLPDQRRVLGSFRAGKEKSFPDAY